MAGYQLKTLTFIGLFSLSSQTIAEERPGGINGNNIVLQSGDVISGGKQFGLDWIAINSSTRGDGLKIEGDGGITVNLKDNNATNSTIGINLSNRADNQLGRGSVLNISNDKTEMATAINIRDSNLSAQQLKINVNSAKMARGVSVLNKSVVDLGQNSHIEVTGVLTKNGAVLESLFGASVSLDQAILNAKNILQVVNVQSSDSKVDLGQNTQINFTTNGTGTALHVFGNNASLKADKLHLRMHSDSNSKASYIMDIQKNSLIDLGSGSELLSNASIGAYVWGTLRADHLKMVSRDAGIDVWPGGYAYIGPGSYLETTGNGNGTLVSRFSQPGANVKRSVIDFIGSEKERNYLLSRGEYAASAQFKGATVNIENSDIVLESKNAVIRGGLWAFMGGEINAKNITIDATAKDGIGVAAENGGIANLSGTIKIDAGSNKIALTTKKTGDRPTTEYGVINVDANLTLLGNIDAVNGGQINLKMQAGSIWQGSSNVDQQSGAKLGLIMNNSVWQMTAPSYVNNLTMDNSTVRFNSIQNSGKQFISSSSAKGNNPNQLPADKRYQVLNLAKLQGQGRFEISTNVVNGESDLIKVSDEAQGNFAVKVRNRGDAIVDDEDSVIIADIAKGDALFFLENKVEVGGYKFALKKQDHPSSLNNKPNEQHQWVLYNTKEASSSASMSINAFSGNYLLNYAETQTVMQRLGELRSINQTNGDFWIRHYSGKFRSAGNNFLDGYKMNYSGLQLGGHKNLRFSDGNLFTGGFLGFSKGNQRNQDGNGTIDAKSVGIYASYMIDNGWYIDNLLKYTWMRNSFTVIDSEGSSVRGDRMATGGIGFSTEIGKRFYLNQQQQWFIEPQLQWNLGRQSAGQFNVSNGLTVKEDGFTANLLRGGVLLGYSQNDSILPLSLYTKFSFVKEFDGKISGQLNDQSYHNSFADIWRVYGIGFNGEFAQRHSFYADIERVDGGKFDQPFRLNIGYRFSW